MFPLHGLRITIVLLVVTKHVVCHSFESDYPPSSERINTADKEILVPNVDMTSKKWFDPAQAMEDLRLSQIRLSTSLRSSLGPSGNEYGELERRIDADNEKLRDDIQRVHRLSDGIRGENKRIQNLPIFRESLSLDDSQAYSFLQIGDNNSTIEDWNYCACGTGPNGTLIFPDRTWPDIPASANISIPSSMLQIHLNGQRLALRQLPECTCTNPWESFDNSSNMCKLINTVTVCLVHASSHPSSPEEIASQAQTLLKAIDNAVSTPSFMEIWTPFRFQF